MTKIEIYIDFEGISNPYAYTLKKVNIFSGFPFCYTLGIFIGKKMKTKTYVYNFSKKDSSEIYDILRKQILKDARELLSKPRFKINSETVKFIGYAPNYDKQILNEIYKGIEVYDISHGKNISISNATSHKINSDKYFVYFRKLLSNHNNYLKREEKGKPISDGELASWAGQILVSETFNLKNRFSIENPNINTIIKELVEYSKDDVVRMQFIKQDINSFFKRAEKVGQILKEKSAAKKNISKLSKVLNFLNSSNYKTIVEAKKDLKSQIKKLEKMSKKDHYLK